MPTARALPEFLDALRPLQEYAAAQAEEASPRELGRLLVEAAGRLCAAVSGGALWMLGKGGGGPLLLAFEAPDGAGRDAASLAESALRSGRAAWSQAASLHRAALPLALEGTPPGALTLELRSLPGPEALERLNGLAAQGALLLRQLSSFERLHAFHMELVETLYRTLNAMDAGSGSRAEEIRRLTRQLALALGLPEGETRQVEYAALLRGVGKVGVDQAILNKPGRLTPKEYDEIKKYTSIGHRILADARLLSHAARMVLHHQEWYNGGGYPEGLRGDAIPLGARILAVVGAWEAMNSPRPYRKALGREESRRELARGAGAQFDPKVVEAFLKLEIQEGGSAGAA